MARSAPDLFCPRCGYDVSGTVPTWTESCPLDGTCSECGLTYAWVDIFRPERVFPKWSFEHSRRRKTLAFLSTTLKTFRPGRLWTQMPLVAPVVRGRLVVMALVILILSHASMMGIALRITWDGMWMTSWWAAKPTTVFIWERLGGTLSWPYSGEWWTLVGPLTLWLVVWGLLIPVPFLVLGDTMAKARCRRTHLLRGGVYFLPVLAVVFVGGAVVFNAGWLAPPSWRVVPWPIWQFLMSLLALAAAAWGARWWWLFTSRYLRLESARVVVSTMLTIAMLASTAICLLATKEFPELLGWILWHVQDWLAGK